MKCTYCGGEVSSQSIRCPFCDRENPEGIAFQEEIRKKIERNKLLKPFLLKQKTPELVQKMLSRIWLLLLGVNCILFVFSFLIFMWGENTGHRNPNPGSFAENYVNCFDITGNWEYEAFYGYMTEIMNAQVTGEEIPEYKVEYLVDYAYDVIAEEADCENEEEEHILTVYAFFQGYLGFEEKDMVFLLPGQDGEYDYKPDEKLKDAAVQLVWEKLEVAK